MLLMGVHYFFWCFWEGEATCSAHGVACHESTDLLVRRQAFPPQLAEESIRAKGRRRMIFVGNDWSEGHHVVYLMDEEGTRLGFARLPEGLEGVAKLHEMVAEHTSDAAEVVVGIETDRGLWVGALIGAGYRVYAINPALRK